MDLSIKVIAKEGEYLASCPELDIFCYGPTPEKARARLKKVMLFYAETAEQLGYQIDVGELISTMEESKPQSVRVFQ